YLLAVKENQPTLYRDCERLFEEALGKDFAGEQYALCGTEEAGHGRKETRTYTLLTELGGLSTRGQWPGLKAVVVVARERVAGGQEGLQRSYYISSRLAAVEELARGIRGHWGIENRLHWVLDVAFGEDRCRTRTGHAAENLGWLRRVALSLLGQDPGQVSIRRKRKRAARDNAFLEHLLFSLSKK